MSLRFVVRRASALSYQADRALTEILSSLPIGRCQTLSQAVTVPDLNGQPNRENRARLGTGEPG